MNGFRVSSASRNVDQPRVALPVVAGVLSFATAVLLGTILALLPAMVGG